jgi:hypothetical protein
MAILIPVTIPEKRMKMFKMSRIDLIVFSRCGIFGVSREQAVACGRCPS